MRTSRKSMFILLTLCCLFSAAQAQVYDTLRIATYNILNYPGSTSATRNPEFRKIIQYMDPDVLILQEVISSAGLTEFLNDVMNFGQPGTYSAAPFSNGTDTDNGLIYKPTKVNYLAQTVLSTALRDINGYQIRPVGVGADSLDIRIYSVHFKASQGFEDERFEEADILRNHLNALTPGFFFAGGDMNLYTSTEPAWDELTGSQADNSGRVYDPINTPGDWHDGPAFAGVHTQSTRLSNIGDGGASGGLDDRFDFLLPTENFQVASGWYYLTGSYTELGNDGAHLNQSINQGANGAVPDSIADALFTASDHLPVFMDVRRQVVGPPSVTLTSPNGSESWYVGFPRDITWTSENVTGTVSLEINRDYPGGAWTSIASGTTDDGIHEWLVAEPLSQFARVRVVVDAQPAVLDVSDANFFILDPSLTLIDPNGGETWFTGTSRNINWTSAGIDGNVIIELNRTYPSASWETLYANTANDGTETWLVNQPISSSARFRVTSIDNPAEGDTSDLDFSISDPFLLLQVPDGGELWTAETSESILWSSGGLSGDLRIQLDRQYPSGIWETLFAGEAVTNQFVDWTVTGPATDAARIRIQLVSDTMFSDTSAGDFEIILLPGPPAITHDPHGDGAPGSVLFTALVTDNLPGFATELFHKTAVAVEYDSVTMTATGNPDEFSASLSLAFGAYDYFIRAVGIESDTSVTDVVRFMISESCGTELAYDDGSAELFNWSPDTGFAWAVRFTPPQTPFVLCEALVAVAGFSPDTAHSLLDLFLLDANGPGGMPGDTLLALRRGSVGNVIGGLPAPGAYWTTVVLQDEGIPAPVVSGDFYLAVSNPPDAVADPQNEAEAFGHDNSSAAGRSVFWDPCDEIWYDDDGVHDNSRFGNRMIRARGWTVEPPELVITSSGNDAILHWSSTGAPYYQVYRGSAAEGPFNIFVGSTADTTITDTGVISGADLQFYIVQSASTP